MQDQELIDFIKKADKAFTSVDLDGDGRHFTVRIISESFLGLSNLKRQQKVLSYLTPLIQSGKLHAINVIALTNEEFQQT
jgi:acid stress-induced BolA-like protein IbaG/YrbA